MLNYALVYPLFPLLTSSLHSKVPGLSGAHLLEWCNVQRMSVMSHSGFPLPESCGTGTYAFRISLCLRVRSRDGYLSCSLLPGAKYQTSIREMHRDNRVCYSTFVTQALFHLLMMLVPTLQLTDCISRYLQGRREVTVVE